MVPALAETPARIAAFTQENLDSCRVVGGAPQIGKGYLTETGDLNGDGAPDYVTDLAALECVNAASLFCGSAGCPVTVWLSGPQDYAVGWGGHAQAWELRGKEVVLSLHGQLCDPPRIGAQGCQIAMRFDQASAGPEKSAASPVSPPPDAAGNGDWQTRRLGVDGLVVAAGPGTGILTALSALCLRDRPVIMAALSESAGAAAVPFGFVFADRRIEVTGVAGTDTQKTYILDPGMAGLAAALSGDAAAVGLQIAGKDQGMLSLSGSTRALRAALSPCLTF